MISCVSLILSLMVTLLAVAGYLTYLQWYGEKRFEEGLREEKMKADSTIKRLNAARQTTEEDWKRRFTI